jgi:hypothetical protein
MNISFYYIRCGFVKGIRFLGVIYEDYIQKCKHKYYIQDNYPRANSKFNKVHFSDIRMIAFGSRGDELLFFR